MKYVWKNISLFFKTEKMIFILVIVCIITSSFIINFSYGLYQNYHVIKDEEESELYEFEIPFNNNLNENYVSKEDLKNTLLSFSDSLNQAIDMYLTMPQCDEIPIEEYGPLFIRFTIKNSDIAPCDLFEENMHTYGTLISGEYFTSEQEKNGENVALVFDGDITEKLMKDDETIIFQNKEFKMVGLQKMHPLIVPFNSLNEDTPVNTLLLHFIKPITRSQYNEIKEKIELSFGDIANVPELNIPETENYYLYNTIIIISIIIALLAAINFAVLYKYILLKRIKTLSIFRMCGCSKWKALRLFLIECMLLTIPLFIVTTFIYDSFILPVLSKRFEYIASAYSTTLYIIIFAIYVLSSLLVLGIMIYFGFLRKTIRVTKGGR